MTEIKITRTLIKNYQKTVREIPLLEMELEEMKARAGEAGNIADACLSQKAFSLDIEKYRKRQDILKRKKQEVEAVREWIEAIEDGQTRCVFRLYYIEGGAWSKVARAAGYGGNEDYPRRYIRDKYLYKCGIK